MLGGLGIAGNHNFGFGNLLGGYGEVPNEVGDRTPFPWGSSGGAQSCENVKQNPLISAAPFVRVRRFFTIVWISQGELNKEKKKSEGTMKEGKRTETKNHTYNHITMKKEYEKPRQNHQKV